MIGRAVLSQLCRNRALNTRVPSRGKSLENWHRPTMAEYGEPKLPWGPESAKRAKVHNMQFLGGAAFLAFTLACGYQLNAFIFNTTPWDIVYTVRGTDVSGIEDKKSE